MRWSMAFGLKLIDQFTNLPITGVGVWIRDNAGKLLIRKADGWFVLLDNREESRTLFIDVTGYEPEKVYVDCKTMKEKKEPGFYQYLIPSRIYAWPYGIFFQEEAGDPGTAQWVLWPETEGILRLLQDYDPSKDSCRLPLKIPRGFPVRDRRIVIKSGEKEAEICTILNQENTGCTMEYPLKQIYLAKETRISLMYRTVYDSAGISRIPVLLEKR